MRERELKKELYEIRKSLESLSNGLKILLSYIMGNDEEPDGVRPPKPETNLIPKGRDYVG